ncbi:MAG: hypothetical protein CM15mP114_08360 [Alphaproteobacteria bacterium]|nr:MAG: hypothetical protein CM15mP114_08360 [Alphaproteobacteria bacterium]
MKIKFLLIFVFLIPLGMLSSCSDFRKAVGKEIVVPDEFSVAVTPSLLIPPGYKIDPQSLKNNDLEKTNDNFNLNEEIDIKDKKEANSFNEMFDVKNVPKNIRKLVDEETLGISLGERRGIDILFGNIPKTGVVIDSKKEAIRIKKNKLSKQNINSNPSPAVDINSGKPLLIK